MSIPLALCLPIFSFFLGSQRNFTGIFNILIDIFQLIFSVRTVICKIYNKISSDFVTTPSDLPVYFRLVEGSFNNIGTAGTQVYINYPANINFVADMTGISNCTEIQFFDVKTQRCRGKKII